jgi:hypothetical protein
LTVNQSSLFSDEQDVAEYLSKISNSVINLLGIVGLVIGLAEIQQLNFRDPETLLHMEMDLVSYF